MLDDMHTTIAASAKQDHLATGLLLSCLYCLNLVTDRAYWFRGVGGFKLLASQHHWYSAHDIICVCGVQMEENTTSVAVTKAR